MFRLDMLQRRMLLCTREKYKNIEARNKRRLKKTLTINGHPTSCQLSGVYSSFQLIILVFRPAISLIRSYS